MIIFKRLLVKSSTHSKYRITRQDPEDHERFTEDGNKPTENFKIETSLGSVWVFRRAHPQFEHSSSNNYLYLRGKKDSYDNEIISVPNAKVPLVELVMSIIGKLEKDEPPLPTLEES